MQTSFIEMEDQLNELKSVLRSLVVSSPAQIDVRTLLRDYKEMVGTPLPLGKFGYRDPIEFLKERCSDSFLFQGPISNPVLTLIVPDSLKHIDRLVQKQKSQIKKYKEKRKSVMKSTLTSPEKESNLIVKTFSKNIVNNQSIMVDNKKNINNTIESQERKFHKRTVGMSQNRIPMLDSCEDHGRKIINKSTNNTVAHPVRHTQPTEVFSENDMGSYSSEVDSARQTLSSNSSSKQTQLTAVLEEVAAIVTEHPDGLWATDILKLYRKRYGCELNFVRFGYTSIVSLLQLAPGVSYAQVRGGDWRVWAGVSPMRLPPASPPPLLRLRTPTPDPDDALPGVQFEPDVFPADCLHYTEEIPVMELEDLRPGDILDVIVGEVYSPSHFWMQRIGEQHNLAMEDIMDQMNEFYDRRPEGAQRLATGAVRRGHHCSCRYEGDWHRSLIVKMIDSDTVKVRHVDYGTVERVQTQSLRPLRREFAALPVQAIRARLSRVHPPNSGRRWPRASATAFLELVAQKSLVAAVAVVDVENKTLEVALVDTSTEEDVFMADELVRTGYADPYHVIYSPSEPYLLPTFDALENGDTLNYAEISSYLRDGVVLDYLDEYRRHVPSALPPTSPSSPFHSLNGAVMSVCDVNNLNIPPEIDNHGGNDRVSDSLDGAKGGWPDRTEADWAEGVGAEWPHSAEKDVDCVALPVRVCKTFQLLRAVNPTVAIHYISEALDRALAKPILAPPPGFSSTSCFKQPPSF